MIRKRGEIARRFLTKATERISSGENPTLGFRVMISLRKGWGRGSGPGGLVSPQPGRRGPLPAHTQELELEIKDQRSSIIKV